MFYHVGLHFVYIFIGSKLCWSKVDLISNQTRKSRGNIFTSWFGSSHIKENPIHFTTHNSSIAALFISRGIGLTWFVCSYALLSGFFWRKSSIIRAWISLFPGGSFMASIQNKHRYCLVRCDCR